MTSVFDDFNSSTNEDEINAAIEQYKSRFTKDDGSVDVDAMFKKIAHADKHIKTIESERATEKDTDSLAAKLEEVLTKIEAKSNTSGNNYQEPSTVNNNSSSDTVDIDKILERKLQEYESKNTRERNRQSVRDELIRTWGNDWQVKLQAKVRELGEDQQFLDALAAERPQTFLRLIKEEKGGVFDSFAAPQSSHRITDKGTKTGPKTYTEFEKIRKENPSLYKSRVIQDQLLKLTGEYAAQGKSFTET